MVHYRVKTSVIIGSILLFIPLLLLFLVLIRALWDISAIMPTEETFSFSVSEHEVLGEGFYCYSNNAPRKVMLPLIFPFPVDSEHPFPTTLSLHDGTGRLCSFLKIGSAICFSLVIPPVSEGTLRLSYRQCTGNSSSFSYIIAMNDLCRRPLGKARYRVTVPSEYQLKESIPAPAEIDEKGTEREYLFSYDGIPPENGGVFSFSWSTAKCER